jgi:hypothetical protein
MPANIVKTPDLLVVAFHCDYAFVSNFTKREATCVREILSPSNTEPAFAEDAIDFLLVNFGIMKILPRKTSGFG